MPTPRVNIARANRALPCETTALLKRKPVEARGVRRRLASLSLSRLEPVSAGARHRLPPIALITGFDPGEDCVPCLPLPREAQREISKASGQTATLKGVRLPRFSTPSSLRPLKAAPLQYNFACLMTVAGNSV